MTDERSNTFVEALLRLREATTGITIGNMIQLKKNKRTYQKMLSLLDTTATWLERVKGLEYKEK